MGPARGRYDVPAGESGVPGLNGLPGLSGLSAGVPGGAPRVPAVIR